MRKQHTWRDPRVAADYHRRRFAGPLQRAKHRHDEALLERLLVRAAVGAGARVLDLPAGTGRLLPVLARGGRRVVAADLSLPMLTAGGPPPAGVLGRVAASAFATPFADDAFDASIAMRFLFHLDDRTERVQVLRELARVTRHVVVGQVRYRATVKHAGRWLRSRLGASARYAPSNTRRDVALELAEAGLLLERLVPVSRVFSDKALFVARRGGPTAPGGVRSPAGRA